MPVKSATTVSVDNAHPQSPAMLASPFGGTAVCTIRPLAGNAAGVQAGWIWGETVVAGV
jgi:aerobic-type carbon monoxide dehydrogenase small subunit (CoxS/CutS family)